MYVISVLLLIPSQVAIKTVSTGHPVNPRIFEIFGREISLMSQLQHPNILLLIGASLDPSHLCYLTEYMHNGNLRDFLIRNPTLAWSMKFNFALGTFLLFRQLIQSQK